MTRTTWILALAMALTCALASGCGDTKCTMDTQCPLAQICVEGRCQDRYPKDGTTDMPTDLMPEGTDVPVEAPDGDVEEEVPAHCTPEFAAQSRTIFGGLSVGTGETQDDPDFPVLMTLSNEQVWVMGRITSSPSATDTPKLTYVTVNPRNALPGGSWYHPLGSVTLDAHHPTVPLGDPPSTDLAMATVFPDVHGIASNQMLFMILGTPPSTGTPTPISGTDAYSTEPAAASAGMQFMAVWRQGNSTDGNSNISFAIVDSTGTVTGPGVAAGDSTADLGQPVLVHNGTGYGLAYFTHAGAGADTVQFLELDAAGAAVSGSSLSWTASGDNTVVGRPALEWSGAGYALLWEESGGSGDATFHLNLVAPGGTGSTDVSLGEALSPTTGTLTNGQAGMMDVVWTGEALGAVWVHQNPTTGTHVWFFEMDEAGAITDGPHVLNETSTQSHNPTITWIETTTGMRYYVFGWNEFSSTSGVQVLYTYTYGCQDA